MTPLRKIRLKRGWQLVDVAEDTEINKGRLSRIETGAVQATTVQAETLSVYYGRGIDEMKILYPERYMDIK